MGVPRKTPAAKKVVAKKEEFYFENSVNELQGPFASLEILLAAAVEDGDVGHGGRLEIYQKVKTVEVSLTPTYKEV